MSDPGGGRLPDCFADFPGGVLLLSADGVVRESNGRLERETGRELVGRPFSEALDPGSSGAKWARIVAGPPEGGDGDAGGTWELVLRGRDTLAEPRAFSVLREEGGIWLVEHRVDARLDDVRDRVTDVVSELTNAQRELVKERGRLARALDELEAKNRETERLSDALREQNEQLEQQNEELLVMTEELRERGEELERSNRALDEFAHVVSHDLKAPLRSIAQRATWLAEDAADALPAEGREHLERIAGRVDRMRSLIDGVLAYARAGRDRSAAERVDVAALLDEVTELLDPPDDVEVRIEGEMPVLETERAPLEQVLLNLVGNAVRYARRGGGTVSISSRRDGSFHEFAVADDGPGVPSGQQAHIWQLFRTLEPEERAEGTGIGLAVVRRLVEAQGGRIEVESAEGAGATFRFLWPAGHDDQQGA